MNKPHIVLITLDHMRADLLGCAGHPLVQTPHIDYLARRGVRFTNAVSTTPLCVPARAMLMTGKEGHRLGVTYNSQYEIRDSNTLPYLLREAGYQTRLIGKMHTFPERKHNGFEQMLLCEEGRPFGAKSGIHRGYDDYERWLAEQGYAGLASAHGIANNEVYAGAWHLPDYTHPTEWIARETCKEIKRRDWSRPQFTWASFTAPHPPFVPLMREWQLYMNDPVPPSVIGEWVDRQPLYHQYNLARFLGDRMGAKQEELAKRAFYALVTHVDRLLGLLIGTLREEGMLDDTWFIFTSDHGDNLGDHHLWAKSNLLKGSCNVPLIVVPPTTGPANYLDNLLAPGWKPGQTSESLAALHDILPTCLDIAGIAAPGGLDGRSLLPAVREPAAARIRSELLGEIGPGKPESGVIGRSLMVLDERYKYIWYDADGCELLFDVRNDPDERRNAAASRPEETARYRERLTAILAARGSDPAIRNGALVPECYAPAHISDTDKARLAVHQTPRGLH